MTVFCKAGGQMIGRTSGTTGTTGTKGMTGMETAVKGASPPHWVGS
jgi:hypothetical protein